MVYGEDASLLRGYCVGWGPQVPLPLSLSPSRRILCSAAHHRRQEVAPRLMGIHVPRSHARRLAVWIADAPNLRMPCRVGAAHFSALCPDPIGSSAAMPPLLAVSWSDCWQIIPPIAFAMRMQEYGGLDEGPLVPDSTRASRGVHRPETWAV